MKLRLGGLSTTALGASLLIAPLNYTSSLITPSAWAKDSHSSTLDTKDVTRLTLENGLRLIVVRNRLAPVVNVRISYLVGSNQAPTGFPGTAHALEHMMFRGSNGLDKDQLTTIGAQLGGRYNAFTTETVTQYYYTAPVDDLDVILKIEALRMNKLSLHAEDWEKERGAIEQEVSRDLSNPIYNYTSKLQQILFKETPYEHDALGTRPSFDQTRIELLRQFYEKYYAPNNAILIIVGDVDPSKTIEQVKADFSSIHSKSIPQNQPFSFKPVHATTLHFPTDFSTGLVTLAWRMPGMQSRDFATATILSDVLSSQRGALYSLVPQGKALMTDFEYIPKTTAGFGVAVAAFPKGSAFQPLLKEMYTLFENIHKNGVPPDLVEAAKRQELAQLSFAANSVEGLAETWTTALAFQGLNNPNDMAAAYRAVTPEDVNRMAKKILDKKSTITAILTPEDSGKPITSKGYGGAESFSSSPEKPVQLPKWADDALQKLNIPPAAPAPIDMTLSNGIRLIVQPVHISKTINLYGHIQQEPVLQEGKDKEGIADITNEMFKYGTTTLNRLAFRKAVDDIAADINTGNDFSLATLSSQFDRGMQLLADNMLHPAFHDNDFKIVRKQEAESLIGLYQSPNYHFGRAIKKAINPPNDPSLRRPDPKKVMQLNLQDLKDFYQKAFRPDLTTIVIAGDITPEHARTIVEKYFSSWKVKGNKPKLDLPQRPNSKASYVLVPDHSALQDSVTLVESLPLDVHHPDHFVLNLGNRILGGGFAGRLYQNLRVKTGYVYTVESSFAWSRNRAGYSLSFGADPDKVSLARNAAIKNLKIIQDTPVTEHELQLAKASLLRSIPLEQASIDKIADNYLYFANSDLPLNNLEIAANIYYKTTIQDIQKAFQTWIRPQDLAEIIKGPVPPKP